MQRGVAQETRNTADIVCVDILYRLFKRNKIGRLVQVHEELVYVGGQRASRSELRIRLSCFRVDCVGDGCTIADLVEMSELSCFKSSMIRDMTEN